MRDMLNIKLAEVLNVLKLKREKRNDYHNLYNNI